MGLVGCEHGIPTAPLPVLILQLGVASHHAMNDREVAAQKIEVTATFLVELLSRDRAPKECRLYSAASSVMARNSASRSGSTLDISHTLPGGRIAMTQCGEAGRSPAVRGGHLSPFAGPRAHRKVRNLALAALHDPHSPMMWPVRLRLRVRRWRLVCGVLGHPMNQRVTVFGLDDAGGSRFKGTRMICICRRRRTPLEPPATEGRRPAS